MLVTLGKRLETQDQGPWLIGTRAKKGIRWTFRTLRMPWPVHHPLSTDRSGCSLETNEARRGQSLSQQRRSAFPWLGCACLGLWALSQAWGERPGLLAPSGGEAPSQDQEQKESEQCCSWRDWGREGELRRGRRSFLAQISQ